MRLRKIARKKMLESDPAKLPYDINKIMLSDIIDKVLLAFENTFHHISVELPFHVNLFIHVKYMSLCKSNVMLVK